MSTYYLIDYENVHDSGLWGTDKLDFDDYVFVFYTVHANKIGLDALEGIQAGLRVIRVQEGNQSLDRHLISYLGYLLGQESDPETRYLVISKDNGYRNIIQFWNNWYGVNDKVKQRARIGCESAVTEAAPFFTPDGRILTARAIRLRRTIIKYMMNHGEKSANGHRYMSVTDLCSYLNSQKDYNDERLSCGKKPMVFLIEELNDILLIRHEYHSDIVYLISEEEYWEQTEAGLPDDEGAGAEENAADESVADASDPEETADLHVDENVGVSEPAAADEEHPSADHAAEEKLCAVIRSIIRQSFDSDAELDTQGRRRLRASLLRDRLDKIRRYHQEQSESGQKPLDYLAKAALDLVEIRTEKGRSWAYLLAEAPVEKEPADDAPDIPEPDTLESPKSDTRETPKPLHITEGMKAVLRHTVGSPEMAKMECIESAVLTKLTTSGKDEQTAAVIAAAAAASILSEYPKADFHRRLWERFGQKLGTKYYRETMDVAEECFSFQSQKNASDEVSAVSSDIPIDDMGLSVRSCSSLKRAGFRYAHEFVDLSDGDLLKIRNLGQKGVDEIRKWMQTKTNPSAPATSL